MQQRCQVLHGRHAAATAAAGAGVRKAAVRHVHIPYRRDPTAVVIVVEVVVLTKTAAVRIQVHQHVVEGQHPEGAVRVDEGMRVSRVIGEAVAEANQVAPAVIGLQFVVIVVQREFRAEVDQAGTRPPITLQ